MNCRPIPGGFACGSRARRVKCSVPSCTNWSTLECDYPIPARKSGTCDAKLCERCTTKDGELDHCPPHAGLAAEPEAPKASKGTGDPTPPLCVECGATSALATGKVIYPHRADLYGRWYWLCACGAYVGCHGATKRPLGRPAGPVTRAARGHAHRVFDPLCARKAARDGVTQAEAKAAGYRWLAAQMGRTDGVHIGEMGAEEARRVVEICQRVGK